MCLGSQDIQAPAVLQAHFCGVQACWSCRRATAVGFRNSHLAEDRFCIDLSSAETPTDVNEPLSVSSQRLFILALGCQYSGC